LAKWFGVGRTDTGSGGQERSATVGLHLCCLLGNLLGAASGSRAGDCVPSIGVEVWCSTGCRRCCTTRERRCSDALMKRRQSKPEAAISDEMRAYQHEFVGRGPDRIRTRMVEDLVIVRSFGVLTPAERQLATSFEGRRLIKAMRQQVLEAGRSVLERIVHKHTGAEVISVHSDISTKIGEWLDVFVLDRSIEEE
jgi:uncharacterized protein YbcI